MPAMKAIGLGELMDHVAGRTSLDEALAGMRTETRRYAKRQMTWFRNRMSEWTWLQEADLRNIITSISGEVI